MLELLYGQFGICDILLLLFQVLFEIRQLGIKGDQDRALGLEFRLGSFVVALVP